MTKQLFFTYIVLFVVSFQAKADSTFLNKEVESCKQNQTLADLPAIEYCDFLDENFPQFSGIDLQALLEGEDLSEYYSYFMGKKLEIIFRLEKLLDAYQRTKLISEVSLLKKKPFEVFLFNTENTSKSSYENEIEIVMKKDDSILSCVALPAKNKIACLLPNLSITKEVHTKGKKKIFPRFVRSKEVVTRGNCLRRKHVLKNRIRLIWGRMPGKTTGKKIEKLAQRPNLKFHLQHEKILPAPISSKGASELSQAPMLIDVSFAPKHVHFSGRKTDSKPKNSKNNPPKALTEKSLKKEALNQTITQKTAKAGPMTSIKKLKQKTKKKTENPAPDISIISQGRALAHVDKPQKKTKASLAELLQEPPMISEKMTGNKTASTESELKMEELRGDIKKADNAIAAFRDSFRKQSVLKDFKPSSVAFILDVSPSMMNNDRLKSMKAAIKNALIDNLIHNIDNPNDLKTVSVFPMIPDKELMKKRYLAGAVVNRENISALLDYTDKIEIYEASQSLRLPLQLASLVPNLERIIQYGDAAYYEAKVHPEKTTEFITEDYPYNYNQTRLPKDIEFSLVCLECDKRDRARVVVGELSKLSQKTGGDTFFYNESVHFDGDAMETINGLSTVLTWKLQKEDQLKKLQNNK